MLKIINKRNVGIHPLNCRKNFTNKHNSKAMDKATALVVPLGTVQKVENVEAGIFDLSYIIGDYEYADSAFMALESTVIAHGFSGMFKGITKREIALRLDKSNPLSNYSAETGMTSYHNYTREELLRHCIRFGVDPVSEYHKSRKQNNG